MNTVGQRRRRVGRDLEWISVIFDGNPSPQIAAEAFSRIQSIADCLSIKAYGEDGEFFADDVIKAFTNLKFYIRSFRDERERRELYRQAVCDFAFKAEQTLRSSGLDVGESWLSSTNAND